LQKIKNSAWFSLTGIKGFADTTKNRRYMAIIKTKKDFITQFTSSEFRLLCRHRAFLFLLESNIVQAACLAANLLNRCIGYPISHQFSPEAPKRKATTSARKKPTCLTFRQQLRFGHRFLSS
jgi:hypothetical protein